jgi:hypothetical protein
MTPRTKFYAAASGAILVVLAGLLWTHIARLRVETALAQVTAQRAALVESARRSGRLKAVLESARHVSRPAAAGPRAASPLRVLMGDARLQLLYFAAHRANLPSTYGPLFRSLKLSPDQMRQLEDRIMQRDEQFFDIVSAVPDAIQGASYGGGGLFNRNPFLITSHSEDGDPLQPSTPDGQAAAELLRQNDAAFQEAATALLGPAGYQQILQYERTLPVRDAVDGLGNNLAASQAPLTPEQADQLTQALASASSPYQNGGVARAGNFIDWDESVAQAAQILSPPQLATLQAQVAPAQSMRQLRATVREAGGFGESGKLIYALTGRDD